jgi:F-type H+-transporting ATPase subunit gamma
MKMVAAAKMRRAQERMFAARPYAQKINELIQKIMLGLDDIDEPLLQERSIRKMHLVLVTADKGLCGAFNTHLIKSALIEIDAFEGSDIEMICVGKKGYDFFKKQDVKIAKKYPDIFSDLQFLHAEEIVGYLANEFVEQNTDQVKVIYNQFKSVMQQNLVVEELLPFRIKNSEEKKNIDYLFEPSQRELLKVLLPKNLKMQIWRALLESYAAEQGARMTAMENATENANELIHDLTLQYNKARQASITKEILEIVGGAEALRNAS